LEKKLADFKKKVKKTPLLMSAATQKNSDTAMYELFSVIKTGRIAARMPDPAGVTTEGWRP
jgi:GTPase